MIEAAAMEKFTKWTSEHEAHVAKRQGAHKKARTDRRDKPVVKKVAAKTEAPAPESVEAPSEETKTEE